MKLKSKFENYLTFIINLSNNKYARKYVSIMHITKDIFFKSWAWLKQFYQFISGSSVKFLLFQIFYWDRKYRRRCNNQLSITNKKDGLVSRKFA